MEFSTRIPMLFLSLNVEFAYLKKTVNPNDIGEHNFLWTDGNWYVNEKKILRLCVKVKNYFYLLNHLFWGRDWTKMLKIN